MNFKMMALIVVLGQVSSLYAGEITTSSEQTDVISRALFQTDISDLNLALVARCENESAIFATQLKEVATTVGMSADQIQVKAEIDTTSNTTRDSDGNYNTDYYFQCLPEVTVLDKKFTILAVRKYYKSLSAKKVKIVCDKIAEENNVLPGLLFQKQRLSSTGTADFTTECRAVSYQLIKLP